MIRIFVQANSGPEIIGSFQFLAAPRVGEDFNIPNFDSEGDCRLFIATDILHFAEGVNTEDCGAGPAILVRGDEYP